MLLLLLFNVQLSLSPLSELEAAGFIISPSPCYSIFPSQRVSFSRFIIYVVDHKFAQHNLALGPRVTKVCVRVCVFVRACGTLWWQIEHIRLWFSHNSRKIFMRSLNCQWRLTMYIRCKIRTIVQDTEAHWWNKDQKDDLCRKFCKSSRLWWGWIWNDNLIDMN